MKPRNWPEEFTYSPTSISSEISYEFLRFCLGVPEHEEHISSVIEKARVHPHIKIEILKEAHPLAKVRTKEGYIQRGVFAARSLPAQEELGEYVGALFLENGDEPLEKIFAKHKLSEYAWIAKMHHYFLLIEPKQVANELAFINDFRGIASEPNIGVKWIKHRGSFYFGYVTLSPVEAGDELLVDYGQNYWRRKSPAPPIK